MLIQSIKFVMLDTATLVRLTTAPSDVDVKELSAILKTGDWVPFITWHHLEELFSHENDVECDRRARFLASLPHVAYMATGDEIAVGSCVDLRRTEIADLYAKPDRALAEVIERVTPIARSGFASGEAFMNRKRLWWDFFRANIAARNRVQLEEVANLTHFRPPGSEVPVKLGKNAKPLTIEQWRNHFADMTGLIEKHIRERGDCRRMDPTASASSLMAEAFHETVALTENAGDIVEQMMRRDGVQLERLPQKFSMQDYAYEKLFLNSVEVYCRRTRLSPKDVLARIRKEQMPSWMIWQEIDRRLKSLAKAEVGNVIDKYMAGFAPYVDVFNADKRIAEVLRQSMKKYPLLQTVFAKIPSRPGIKGLVGRLQNRDR